MPNIIVSRAGIVESPDTSNSRAREGGSQIDQQWTVFQDFPKLPHLPCHHHYLSLKKDPRSSEWFARDYENSDACTLSVEDITNWQHTDVQIRTSPPCALGSPTIRSSELVESPAVTSHHTENSAHPLCLATRNVGYGYPYPFGNSTVPYVSATDASSGIFRAVSIPVTLNAASYDWRSMEHKSNWGLWVSTATLLSTLSQQRGYRKRYELLKAAFRQHCYSSTAVSVMSRGQFIGFMQQNWCIEEAYQSVLFNILDKNGREYITENDFIAGFLSFSPYAKHDLSCLPNLEMTSPWITDTSVSGCDVLAVLGSYCKSIAEADSESRDEEEGIPPEMPQVTPSLFSTWLRLQYIFLYYDSNRSGKLELPELTTLVTHLCMCRQRIMLERRASAHPKYQAACEDYQNYSTALSRIFTGLFAHSSASAAKLQDKETAQQKGWGSSTIMRDQVGTLETLSTAATTVQASVDPHRLHRYPHDDHSVDGTRRVLRQFPEATSLDGYLPDAELEVKAGAYAADCLELYKGPLSFRQFWQAARAGDLLGTSLLLRTKKDMAEVFEQLSRSEHYGADNCCERAKYPTDTPSAEAANDKALSSSASGSAAHSSVTDHSSHKENLAANGAIAQLATECDVLSENEVRASIAYTDERPASTTENSPLIDSPLIATEPCSERSRVLDNNDLQDKVVKRVEAECKKAAVIQPRFGGVALSPSRVQNAPIDMVPATMRVIPSPISAKPLPDSPPATPMANSIQNSRTVCCPKECTPTFALHSHESRPTFGNLSRLISPKEAIGLLLSKDDASTLFAVPGRLSHMSIATGGHQDELLNTTGAADNLTSPVQEDDSANSRQKSEGTRTASASSEQDTTFNFSPTAFLTEIEEFRNQRQAERRTAAASLALHWWSDSPKLQLPTLSTQEEEATPSANQSSLTSTSGGAVYTLKSLSPFPIAAHDLILSSRSANTSPGNTDEESNRTNFSPASSRRHTYEQTIAMRVDALTVQYLKDIKEMQCVFNAWKRTSFDPKATPAIHESVENFRWHTAPEGSTTTTTITDELPTMFWDAKNKGKVVARRVMDHVRSVIMSSDTIGNYLELTTVDIIDLCTDAMQILSTEPTVVDVKSPIVVFGDLFGHFDDLVQLLTQHNCWPFPEMCDGTGVIGTATSDTFRCLFLGNYVDYSSYSLDILVLLLSMKVLLPDQIYLLRGNHEDPVMNTKYGFRDECVQKFLRRANVTERRANRVTFHWKQNDDGLSVWHSCCDVFSVLPLGGLIDDDIFCVHAAGKSSVAAIREVMKPITINWPQTENKNQIETDQRVLDCLWSSIVPLSSTNNSGRGDGLHKTAQLCGHKRHNLDLSDVAQYCRENQLKLVVCGHQYAENGYSYSSEGRLVTVFSARDCHPSLGNDDTKTNGTRNDAAILYIQRPLPLTPNDHCGGEKVFPIAIHVLPLCSRHPKSKPCEDNAQMTTKRSSTAFARYEFRGSSLLKRGIQKLKQYKGLSARIFSRIQKHNQAALSGRGKRDEVHFMSRIKALAPCAAVEENHPSCEDSSHSITATAESSPGTFISESKRSCPDKSMTKWADRSPNCRDDNDWDNNRRDSGISRQTYFANAWSQLTPSTYKRTFGGECFSETSEEMPLAPLYFSSFPTVQYYGLKH